MKQQSSWRELVKPFAFYALFIFLGFSSYNNYVNYKTMSTLEKDIQGIVRSSQYITAESMEREILKAALGLSLEIKQEHISVRISYDDQGNPIIISHVTFPFQLNLVVTSIPVALPIEERLTLAFL